MRSILLLKPGSTGSVENISPCSGVCSIAHKSCSNVFWFSILVSSKVPNSFVLNCRVATVSTAPLTVFDTVARTIFVFVSLNSAICFQISSFEARLLTWSGTIGKLISLLCYFQRQLFGNYSNQDINLFNDHKGRNNNFPVRLCLWEKAFQIQ